jgi:signal transduction histidine kinase
MQGMVLTRSSKSAKRLGPEHAAALAAHVQARLEAEKARIARRLHGDVAGMLAAARMDLSRMAQAPSTDAELREQLARVDQILEAVIQNARTEMQRLHPALLDHFGLSAALRHLVEQAGRDGGAEYTIELPDFADGQLPAPMALAAYRVIEALLAERILRRVHVRLREVATRLLLHIEVDAATPPVASAQDDLLALRAWLEALGASWKESSRGAAAAIELELPREKTATATATPSS